MFQGTGSNVGKSVLVAGLGRLLSRAGLRVQPFKPQNMSNNAAVTLNGGEIGRAQALQAWACRVAPTVHMNPVLLKPQTETGAQIIVQGHVWKTAEAGQYQKIKQSLMPRVLESFHLVCEQADIVLVEGAGSASEINLRSHDIANMGFAEAASVNVILIGDINRGGVIASLVGSQVVLPEEDRRRIKAFMVNNMRGDPDLFADGMAFITQRTGWPALGLIPFYDALHWLPAEDREGLQDRFSSSATDAKDHCLKIMVPVLPGLSNFDDLDPLRYHSGVELVLLYPGERAPRVDVILLVGSKTTQSDLTALRHYGWDKVIYEHVAQNRPVFGVCGGYQMLGRVISDPEGIEGSGGSLEGLGLLDMETRITATKRLEYVQGHFISYPTTIQAEDERALSLPFQAYEMHMGVSTGPDTSRPVVQLVKGRMDGAWSESGLVGGCYLHGLFANTEACQYLLKRWGVNGIAENFNDVIERTLDGWADHLEKHVDIESLLRCADYV